jgi:hypothetical protein
VRQLVTVKNVAIISWQPARISDKDLYSARHGRKVTEALVAQDF